MHMIAHFYQNELVRLLICKRFNQQVLSQLSQLARGDLCRVWYITAVRPRQTNL